MNIIIVGGGEVGITLAQELAKEKHDVTIIEKEEKIAEELASGLNAKIINGDATHKSILEEAGAKEADVVVITSPSDEANLLVSLLARDAGCHRIITRANKKEYESLFLKVGVSRVITPEHSVAEQLEAIITQPDIYDLAILHEEVDLFQYEVMAKSKIVGQSYDETLTPKDTLIIAYRRAGVFHIPDHATVFQPSDKVIIIAKKDAVKDIKKLF